MQGLALIDCDNFRDRAKKTRADLHLVAQILVDDVVRVSASVFPDVSELDIRLYGGWTERSGLPSRDAIWLSELLPDLRGRRHGLIIRPTLATAMIEFPELLLRGTVRGTATRQRQKMVDGMMGCDAMYMAANEPAFVSIVTDDEDLLPAAITTHAKNTELLGWIRTREVGSAINDSILKSQGIRIHPLRV